MTTQQKPGTFKRGDPRINRLGRPRTFDAARELAQQIAHEVARSGNSEVVIDGHRVTVTEAILRQWATSKDPRLQQAFMEYAYGKPPTVSQVDLTSGGKPITGYAKVSPDDWDNESASDGA